MTWKEFKSEMDRKGLKDDDEISGIVWDGGEEPHINRFRDGSVEIGERIVGSDEMDW